MKNFVMNAKIDPKIVMDLSIFIIGGWNSLQPSNQKMLEQFIDENEPWLLIGIPSRGSSLVTQYLVLGTTLCEFGSTREGKDVTS